MIQAGSTITTEAWDWKYKNNLDWNHAWGAAPANIIPRYLMGIRPLEPGFSKVLIQPQPGGLEFAKIRIPTIRGEIISQVETQKDKFMILDVEIPEKTTARVELPNPGNQTPDLRLDSRPIEFSPGDKTISVDQIGPGHHRFELNFD